MGFWSKLGKGLLKVAPIAASFIPGVGPIAGMAIGAATSAASRKASGGSWTDAALAGAEGGVNGYGRGIGPSKDPYRTPPYVSDMQGQTNNWAGKLKNAIDSNGGDTGYIGQDIANVAKSGQSGGGISGFMNKLGGVKGIAGIAGGVGGALALKKILSNRGDDVPVDEYGTGSIEPRDMGTSRFQRRMQRELGPVMGETNQNNPNLALSIGQGRMDAMRDQPFRGGYDVRTVTGYDDEDNPEYQYTPIPRIGPNYRQPRRDKYYGGGAR